MYGLHNSTDGTKHTDLSARNWLTVYRLAEQCPEEEHVDDFTAHARRRIVDTIRPQHDIHTNEYTYHGRADTMVQQHTSRKQCR